MARATEYKPAFTYCATCRWNCSYGRYAAHLRGKAHKASAARRWAAELLLAGDDKANVYVGPATMHLRSGEKVLVAAYRWDELGHCIVVNEKTRQVFQYFRSEFVDIDGSRRA